MRASSPFTRTHTRTTHTYTFPYTRPGTLVTRCNLTSAIILMIWISASFRNYSVDQTRLRAAAPPPPPRTMRILRASAAQAMGNDLRANARNLRPSCVCLWSSAIACDLAAVTRHNTHAIPFGHTHVRMRAPGARKIGFRSLALPCLASRHAMPCLGLQLFNSRAHISARLFIFLCVRLSPEPSLRGGLG